MCVYIYIYILYIYITSNPYYSTLFGTLKDFVKVFDCAFPFTSELLFEQINDAGGDKYSIMSLFVILIKFKVKSDAMFKYGMDAHRQIQNHLGRQQNEYSFVSFRNFVPDLASSLPLAGRAEGPEMGLYLRTASEGYETSIS